MSSGYLASFAHIWAGAQVSGSVSAGAGPGCPVGTLVAEESLWLPDVVDGSGMGSERRQVCSSRLSGQAPEQLGAR